MNQQPMNIKQGLFKLKVNRNKKRSKAREEFHELGQAIRRSIEREKERRIRERK